MRQVFNINASASMKKRYAELLREEYSETSLDDAVALFRKILETSGYRIVFDWEKASSRKPPYKIPSSANDYLKEFLERANAGLPAEVPDEVRDRTVLERRAQELAVFLTFQSRVTLQGDSGFVRDVQSLLFQLSIHVFAPRLVNRRLDQAHAYLLHALYAHVQLAWTDEPSHQHYLLSTLYEHSGNRNAALHLLRAALDNASPDDHDYLTKAQTYWSLLVEDDRTDEAKAFLLDLYRRAATKDLPEIRELVEETYALGPRIRRAS